MNSSLTAVFAALVSFVPVASAQTICIRVYDFAHVPSATLDAALTETATLFKPAGIGINWQLNMPLPAGWKLDMTVPKLLTADSRPYLAVSIVTGFPDTALPGALGFALPFAHTGPHATIFYNRVEGAARMANAPEYLALGHAIAHELGHDLLRSQDHSPGGLMQARWGRAGWQLAKQGLLGFSPAERERIRLIALEINLNAAQQTRSAPGSSPQPASDSAGNRNSAVK